MQYLKWLVAAYVLGMSLSSGAVCLDPKTFVSGYHTPLDDEVRTTKNIAIGKVTKVEPINEDSSDPAGISAHVYTVKLLQQLKGRLPKVLKLWEANTSSRYPMAVGEEHLIFITMIGKKLAINSCGNSSVLSDGFLEQVRTRLESKPGAF